MEEDKTGEGKGAVGDDTGGKVRRIMNRLQEDGMSIAQIARIVNRDPDTVSNIMSGNIQNPPNDLLERLEQAARRRGVSTA